MTDLRSLDLDAQRAAAEAIIALWFSFAGLVPLCLHRAELDHAIRLVQDLARIQTRRRLERAMRREAGEMAGRGN